MLSWVLSTGLLLWLAHTVYHAGARSGARQMRNVPADVVTLGQGHAGPFAGLDEGELFFLAHVCRHENRATLVVDRASLSSLRLFAQIAKEHGEAGESPVLHARAHTMGGVLQDALGELGRR